MIVNKRGYVDTDSESDTRVSSTNTTRMEWHILHDGEELWNQDWPASSTFDIGPEATCAHRRRRRLRFARRIVLMLLLAAAVGGVALWREASIGARLIEHELQSAIDLEEYAANHAGATAAVRATAAYIPDDARLGLTDGGWNLPQGTTDGERTISTMELEIELEEVNFYKDLAVVRVVVTRTEPDGQTIAYRELRFYRHDGTQWVRSAPDDGYWGEMQTLETEHFTFRFRRRDAANVTAVMASLDAIYAGLRTDLRLPVASEKLVIQVDGVTQTELMARFRNNQVRVSSPAQLSIPADLSESQLLFLWLLDPVVRYALAEAQEARPLLSEWRQMAGTLHRWQMRRHSELLAAWHDDLVRWLYGDIGDEPRISSLQRLCAKHQVAVRAAFLAGMAATHLCTAPHLVGLAQVSEQEPPSRLHQLALSTSDPSAAESWNWMDEKALETVLDYGVSAYGREGISELWQGFHDHATWEDLIPNEWGVAAEEFEASWLDYVDEIAAE